ncbi:acid-sensing ion channel 1A-like [Mytilus galloprovincialis]|uniref:acid-sensing ion channel 1A-like n=1 Tax=Mytilus galloprovincialis TaxID=29158 RepID=UPI003F7C0DF2
MPFVKVRPAHDKASKDFRNIDNSQQEELKNDLTCTPSGNESIINKLNCQEKEILKSNTNSVNVESLWREFRENTTMHGLKHARRENKYQLRWVIWIIALFGMGSLLVYTVYTLFAYYRTNPTLTNINLKFVREMFYPAVTICNMSPYKLSAINASAVMMSHLLHSSRLGVVLPPLDYTNPAYAELNDSLSKDWLDNVSFDLDDMFMYCVNERHVIACKNILKAKVTQWGKCFTYNSNEKLPTEGRVKGSMTGSATALTFYINIKQDEYVFNTNMAAGVKIILHDPEEEPDVNNKGFISSPGMSTYVSMKMTKYKYLPAPYKAGGDQYCIDTKSPGFENTLKYQQFYSRTGCQLQCRRDFIVNQCGCRAVTDPGNETLCSPIMAATCYYQNEVEFDSNAELKEQCKCQISCEFTTFDQSISTSTSPADVYFPILQSMGYTDIKNNILEVRLYYDSLSYLLVESIPEYNTEDIVGILGGQMGIFLGASLLTLSELIEFVILSVAMVMKKCYRCAFRKKNEQNEQDLTQYY